MSQNRKILKLLSFAQVIVALIAIAFGALSLTRATGGAEAIRSLLGIALPVSVWSGARGVALALLAVVTMAAARGGIQGANRPRSIGGQGKLALAGVILGIACTAASLVLAASADAAIAGLVTLLDLAAAICGARVRRELDR